MTGSSFIFKENRVFIEEDKVEEELDGNENLVGFPRLIFIDEECDNTQVDVDGGELTRKNNSKKKSDVYKPIDAKSVTNDVDETLAIMIFLVVTIFACRL